MEKLIRILFVMCALTFITTVTACRAGNQQPVEQPFLINLPDNREGITIDETGDVVKVTIKPSLLTYVAGTHRAPIFTITFKNQEKGFIIPTSADKAAHTIIRMAGLRADVSEIVEGDMSDDTIVARTSGYLTDTDTLGFDFIANNPGWLHALIELFDDHTEDHIYDNRAYLVCETTLTGINERSFATLAPAVDDDLAFGNDTKTECFLNIQTDVTRDTEDLKTESRKKWAAKVVELNTADPGAYRNLQKVNFFGIVTGDHKASAIAKVAPTLVESEDAVSLADITNLINTYTNNGFQKVEIVIAEEK